MYDEKCATSNAPALRMNAATNSELLQHCGATTVLPLLKRLFSGG